MSNRTLALHRGLAVSVTLVTAVATLAARQPARVPSLPSAAAQTSAGVAGPIAISMRQANEAMVLQADGRVFALDTGRGAVGSQFYRVPASYQAVDMAAGTTPAGPIVCFTLNKSASKDYGSYVLQIMPDRREIWTFLSPGGVYVGIVLDAAAGQVYVANSTNNGIYRVAVGEKGARPQPVAILSAAERIGAMAIDPEGRRLFVSDMGADRVYVVSLNGSAKPKSIALGGIEEVRAIAWNGRARQIYAADSGQESIWAIDPDGPSAKPQRVLRDRRVKEPAGLAVAGDGTLWVADELARSLFQVSLNERGRILRNVAWDTARGK